MLFLDYYSSSVSRLCILRGFNRCRRLRHVKSVGSFEWLLVVVVILNSAGRQACFSSFSFPFRIDFHRKHCERQCWLLVARMSCFLARGFSCTPAQPRGGFCSEREAQSGQERHQRWRVSPVSPRCLRQPLAPRRCRREYGTAAKAITTKRMLGEELRIGTKLLRGNV